MNIETEYSSTNNQTYLNTASCGLISKSTLTAMQTYNERFMEHGSVVAEDWMMNKWESCRTTVADFFGAIVEQTALIPNFSFGYNAVLETVGPKKVLVYENDYPSLLLPLQLKGFELNTFTSSNNFDFDLNEIEDIIRKENIELLVISHVQFRTGYKANLEQLGNLCKKYNVIFIVDATQSAGAVSIDFNALPIDALLFSNYKWLNAGMGTGTLLIKQSILEQFEPKIGGFGSFIQENDSLVYKPSILSFQPSHPNVPGCEALKQAISEKQDLGIKSIEKHNKDLLRQLIIGLEEKEIPIFGAYHSDQRAGYVCLPFTEQQFELLKKNRVIATFRNNSLRIGPHFYNTSDHINRFLELV